MKIQFMNLIKIKILALIFSLTFLPISFVRSQSTGFEYIKGMELMDMIYQHLEMYFVDDIKPGKMSKDAIDAMLKGLDPYTVYIHESDLEDYRLMTTGQYGGIGALIRKIDKYTYIAEPYEGNPAQKSGLLAGDKILFIDGKNMFDKPSDEVSSALKGPKGSSIEVKLLRNEKDELTIPITRDEIKIPDVPFSGMLDDKIGYIKLNSFTQTASAEVKKSYQDLKQKNVQQLILDLRGNGGGLLIEAVKIVNFFVKKGQLVVSTKGRIPEENRVYKTTDEPLDLNIPLIVLIDENSASASEIVAGSLQDLDRAVIVGTTSFGKGLVQRTYDLKYGSKVKMTIAKYYTPSGRCVQKLEYYEKAVNDRPKEIPDSLIKIFKTQNGRKVIDGRGIEPDVVIDERNFNRFTAMLVGNNLMFDFATQYYFKHPSIASAETFSLSENDYNEFKKIVVKDTFNYTTASEEMLQKMKEVVEEEEYYNDIKTEYESILKKVTPSKERDLEKFKPEIIEMLENEIVSRYYFQKGRALASFKHDEYIIKSKDLFKDLNAYHTILK
ncbi:MAG: S41 family peptidase [Flavobacteriia bacterium]|nr:S41 family peptidase [Flavobacteriia bacterium]